MSITAPEPVYRPKESQEGGNLFAGQRFWIGLKVVNRKSIVKAITDNGGTLDLNPRSADVLIAEPTQPRHAPAGALSWHYVTDSIDRCQLQETDRYQIETGKGSLPRITRTSFSPEDDRILVDWVCSAEPNRSASVNFFELEKAHPRHTWQSWKSRWTKKFQGLPPGQLPQRSAAASMAATPLAPLEYPQSPVAPSAGQEGSPTGPLGSKQATGSAGHFAPASAARSALKAQFHHALSVFSKAEQNMTRSRMIEGLSVELWDLHQAVLRNRTITGVIGWALVTRDLGFNNAAQSEVQQSVRECYDEYLLKFNEFLSKSAREPAAPAAQMDSTQEQLLVREPVSVSPSGKQDVAVVLFEAIRDELRDLESGFNSSSGGDKDVSSSFTPSPASRRSQYSPHSRASFRSGEESPAQKRRRISRDDDAEVLAPSGCPPQASGSPPPAATHPSEERLDRASDIDDGPSTLDLTPSEQLVAEVQARQSAQSPLAGPAALLAARGASAASPNAVPRARKRARRQPPRIQRRSVANGTENAELSAMALSPPTSTAAHNDHISRPDVDDGDELNRRAIEHEMASCRALGFSARTVVEALHRTSMTPGGAATMVMDCLHRQRQIPSKCRGVWTDAEDMTLRAGAQSDMHQLHQKHGLPNVELRLRYLIAFDRVIAEQGGQGLVGESI